ncbi:hypothetical protein IPM19_04795 [bacterium]|nr:MAG: hypothetical protein IPM19_04795 [bacterium]
MKKIIENIRQKPDHHKNRIILIITGSVAFVLVIIWIIIGIPDREGRSTDVIDDFTTNVEESKDTLPKLFESNN